MTTNEVRTEEQHRFLEAMRYMIDFCDSQKDKEYHCQNCSCRRLCDCMGYMVIPSTWSRELKKAGVE